MECFFKKKEGREEIVHIIFATASSGTLADTVKAHEKITETYSELELSLFLTEKPLSTEQWNRFEIVCQSANLFIYDPHAVENDVVMKMAEIAKKHECEQISLMLNGAKWEQLIHFGALREGDIQIHFESGEIALSTKAKGLKLIDRQLKEQAIENYKQIKSYWHASSMENWKELIYFTARLYGNTNVPEAKAPSSIEKTGIIDPKTGSYYSSANIYLQDTNRDLSKPKIVFFYIATQSRVKSAALITELIERLRPVATVIPIGLTSIMKIDLENLEGVLSEILHDVQLIVNFIGFRLGSGPSGGDIGEVTDWLEELNIPMLHPFFLTRTTVAEWEEAKGLSPVEAMVNVVFPELDGAIETYPIAAVQSAGFNKVYQFEKKELVLIEERVDYFLNRVKRWLHLRKTSNDDKRIALIGYNYPPGEGNLFGGSFLDTFRSISALLDTLADEGYRVERMTGDELERRFRQYQLFNEASWGIEEDLDQRLRYPVSKMRDAWNNNLDSERLKSYWGEYPGEIMTNGEDFFIPGLINGNVFIGLQPSRNGASQNSSANYHDQSIPPHYQYQAFYAWVEKEFKSDAIVHIGTHGTLEYLPGKENGMSSKCYPDQLVQSLPHFYFYYVGNPSEAMLAKRRTHAVLSSYQAPPFKDGGLYGDYEELERLLHEYREAEQVDPLRCEEILKEIQALADENGFSHQQLEDIEQELQKMQYALIPYGLHTIGEGMRHEDAIHHTVYTLRKEHKGNTLKQLVSQFRPEL